MNIFYLDKDPKLCAQYHTDRHIVKMILESAQMLCTAVRELGGTATKIIYPNGKTKIVKLLPNETYSFEVIKEQVQAFDEYGDEIEGEFIEVIKYKLVLSSGLYVSTHINHPCSIWVREKYMNFSYVFQLMLELEKEWQARYNHNKKHASVTLLVNSFIVEQAKNLLPLGISTKPALAMPDYCKISSDPVECYREYYRKEKIALHKWTNRDKPYWL